MMEKGKSISAIEESRNFPREVKMKPAIRYGWVQVKKVQGDEEKN